MKRKLLTALLCVAAVLCLCFGLAACDRNLFVPNTPNTQTQTGSGNNNPGGGNNQNGLQGGSSSENQDGSQKSDEDDPTTPHTHIFSDQWTADENEHWHAATCGHSDTKDKAAHTYANGVCTTCNHAHEAHTYGTYTADDGGHTHTCTVCHKAESGVHTYTDGVCTTCGDIAGLIAFKTLQTGSGNTAYGKVSNVTEGFSFADEIMVTNGASYAVYTDLAQPHEIENKTVPLTVGDNTFYIFASRGSGFKIYTVTLRRRPVYTVNFATSGSAVSSQQVEEDGTIAAPAATTRTGYTFRGWKLNGADATFPCKAEAGISYAGNYTVTFYAAFTANEYKVTLDAKGGEITGNEQTVTYDNFYNFPVPTRRGYTFAGWYDGETQLTNAWGQSNSVWNVAESKNAEAHWEIGRYYLNVVAQNDGYYHGGEVAGAGQYAYQSEVTITATPYLGYHFLGWYDGADEKVSESESYTFTMDLGQTLTAKWQVNSEMENFDFTSDATTCTLTGIKDKTVTEIYIPAYVTQIAGGTFSYCNVLESITVAQENANYSSQDGILYNKEKTEFVYIPQAIKGDVTIPDGVTEIGRWAFQERYGLTSVTIGSGVTQIGEGAFASCIGLTSVTIGKATTSIANNAFMFCCKLIEVWNYSRLKFIEGNLGNGGIAQYAKQVYTEEMSGKQTVKDDYLFYEDGDEVYLLGYVGEGTELTLPTASPSGKSYKIYQYAFYDCDWLTSVTISSGVTSIDRYAFLGCIGLTSATFTNPNGWSAEGTELQSEDLQDKFIAAQYLRDVYSHFIWTRQ